MSISLYGISVVVLASISVLSSSLVIFAHFKIPQLLKHPGQMTVIIGAVQVVVDLQWITSVPAIQSYSLFRKIISSGACYYIGIIFMILVFLWWNLLSISILEMVFKVKYPLKTNYGYRFKKYLIFSVLFTTAETIPSMYFGTFGLSVGGDCFLADGSFSYWFILIPVFVNIPFNFIGIIILICTKEYNNNNALQRMVLVHFSMTICLGIPLFVSTWVTLFDFKNEYVAKTALLLGCSSGTVLAVCRLGSLKILKKLFAVAKQKKKPKVERLESLNRVLVEEISIHTFFEDVTKETFRDLIITFCMLLSAESCTKLDYCYHYEKHKYIFSQEDYRKFNRIMFPPELTKNEEIWEYGKQYFDKIKECCGTENEDLFRSFNLCDNFSFINSNCSGKSGAIILMTHDERFALKVLTRDERYLLLQILPNYSERIKDANSMLVRILGLYKIKSIKTSFIIMENIVEHRRNAVIFDLKGSLYQRYVEVENEMDGVVMKDQNFREMNYKISVTSEKKNEILKILAEDIKFLNESKVLDYSLIAAFYKEGDLTNRYKITGTEQEVYTIGIIDFLQGYTLAKRAELFFKKIQFKVNMSVCSPKKYSVRFLKAIDEYLFK